MSTELFELVHAAEEKAEAVMLEAQREARELVKVAQAACAQSERDMAREHRALYQSILEEKRASTQRKLDAEAAEELKSIDEEMKIARERLPQAVKRIAERVMDDGDR